MSAPAHIRGPACARLARPPPLATARARSRRRSPDNSTARNAGTACRARSPNSARRVRFAPMKLSAPAIGVSVHIGEHQQHLIPHPLAEQVEGLARQIGRAPFARAGILVEVPERIPMLWLDVCARQCADFHPVLGRSAFLRGSPCACGRPVRPGNRRSWRSPCFPSGTGCRCAAASRPASNSGICAGSMKVAWAEENPSRSQRVSAARSSGAASAIVLQQQARAGRRRERHGDLQLGIIIASRAVPGVGPGMVEHIFALAVALEHRQATRRRAGHSHPRSRSATGLQPVPGPTLPESSSAVRNA